MTGSNRRPPACKAGALPAELIPQASRSTATAAPATIGTNHWKNLVGLVGLEPTTPALSRRCSNQLSYRPFTQGAGRRSLTKPALSRHGGALPAHFDMLRSTTADKSGRSRSSAFGSARSRRRSCMQDRSPRCGFAVFQKGGDPAAPSDTATLLRLHPSHEPCRGNRPPCG